MAPKEPRREQIPPVGPVTQDRDDDLNRRIAEKAYDLYVRRGRAPGADLDDWLAAERMVQEETDRRGGTQFPRSGLAMPRRRVVTRSAAPRDRQSGN